MSRVTPGGAEQQPAAPVLLYECLVAIDHTADHRIYPAGSVINLEHLPAAARAMLVARGYVRPTADVGGAG